MGNTVTLQVVSALGGRPESVEGEWELQYVLPFLWLGLAPSATWRAHGDRTATAMLDGRDPDDDAFLMMPWEDARAVYEARLPGISSAMPEVGVVAERFLGDLRHVAARTPDPWVRILLAELVTMYDVDDVEQYAAALAVEAGRWDDPSEAVDGTDDDDDDDTDVGVDVCDLAVARTVVEPERSMMLGGEWTAGGTPAPRKRPPESPAPAPLAPDRHTQMLRPEPRAEEAKVYGIGDTPPVPKPDWISQEQWDGRWGPHGEDLWLDARNDAIRRETLRSMRQAALYPWWWTLIVSIVFGAVIWLITGMFTQSLPLACVLGGAVLALVWLWWGQAKRRAERPTP